MLKEEFLSATVLFCQWYVMKAMFKKKVECDGEKVKEMKQEATTSVSIFKEC